MDEKYKVRYFDKELEIDVVEVDLGGFIKDKVIDNRKFIVFCCLVIVVVGCFFPITFFKIAIGILVFFASIILGTLGFMWAMKG